MEDDRLRPGEPAHESGEGALLAAEYARRGWDMSDIFAAHDVRNATVAARDDARKSAMELRRPTGFARPRYLAAGNAAGFAGETAQGLWAVRVSTYG